MRTTVRHYRPHEVAARIADGRLSRPAYQRPLAWTPGQVLAFIQSCHEGYPIGAALVWRLPSGQGLVLDGQQRLTAICGMRPGSPDEHHADVSWHAVERRWVLAPTDPETLLTVSVRTVVSGGGLLSYLVGIMRQFIDAHGVEAWEAMVCAFDRLDRATIVWHELEDATPAQAVEAFRRLNTGGSPMTEDEVEALIAASEGEP